jgi:hypothetical protein
MLHMNEGRTGRPVDIVSNHDVSQGVHQEPSRRSDQPLAQVTVAVGDLENRHDGFDLVFFARYPLVGAAARPQHENKRSLYRDIERQVTTGT